MPASDREVYAYFTADENTPVEIDMLAYAVFANERQQWIEHFEKTKGQLPSEEEIGQWTANLTDWQFTGMRQEAIRFYDRAALKYLEADIASARAEVLRSALVREVRAASSFWRQLAIALLTAILAPIIIGGMLLLTLIYEGESLTASGVLDRLQRPPSRSAPNTSGEPQR